MSSKFARPSWPWQPPAVCKLAPAERLPEHTPITDKVLTGVVAYYDYLPSGHPNMNDLACFQPYEAADTWDADIHRGIYTWAFELEYFATTQTMTLLLTVLVAGSPAFDTAWNHFTPQTMDPFDTGLLQIPDLTPPAKVLIRLRE